MWGWTTTPRAALFAIALLAGGCTSQARPSGMDLHMSADEYNDAMEIEQERQKAEVAAVLDAFHAAAARADGPAYFDLFASGAVFIGTDAAERWSVSELRAYAAPLFSQGRGWTYRPRKRTVTLGLDGDSAWFDELLDNQTYGTSRGTGVLQRIHGRWLISQYHLTFPVPNNLAKEVTGRIKSYEAEQAAKVSPAP